MWRAHDPAHRGGRMSIADVLLERGLVTPEELSEAGQLRKQQGVRLDQALIELGYVGEEDLLKVMSDQLSIPIVDLSGAEIDVQTLRSLPAMRFWARCCFSTRKPTTLWRNTCAWWRRPPRRSPIRSTTPSCTS